MTATALASLALALTGCARHALAPGVAAEATLREPPPPGMLELDFVTHDRGRAWVVKAGDQEPCTTPCTQWVRPHDGLTLTSRNGRQRIDVYDLGAEARSARRALVVAEGPSRGKRVNGIVFTTFGGMGLVTGITLTAAGCSNAQERPGLCKAGLITGGVSASVTAVAIWMLVDSGPKAHVLPIFTTRAANGEPAASVAILPTGVAGTF